MQLYILAGLSVFFVSCMGAADGVKNPLPSGRIVGGKPTTIEFHPHQVSIEILRHGSKYEHNCGGSIIFKSWVLTAAHCVKGHNKRTMRIRAGSSYKEIGGGVYKISHVIQHPKYNTEYDVAIIKVHKPFHYSKKIKPIKMVTWTPAVGSVVTATGWGSLKQGGALSNQLQEVQLRVVDKRKCHEKNKIVSAVTDSMMCAGAGLEEKDACQGDSGGPLIYNFELAGIVSWGIGCAMPGYPGVYTDIAFVRDWIVSNVRSH